MKQCPLHLIGDIDCSKFCYQECDTSTPDNTKIFKIYDGYAILRNRAHKIKTYSKNRRGKKRTSLNSYHTFIPAQKLSPVATPFPLAPEPEIHALSESEQHILEQLVASGEDKYIIGRLSL